MHVRSAEGSGEAAVAGITSGLINLGEQVTWRARHFGVWQELTSKITQYERPDYFQDTMLRGAFRSFQHDHYFQQENLGATMMTDVLRFEVPFAIAGSMAEIFLRPYLARFLRERNAVLKKVAEGEEWKQYLLY
ncbi:SRPBCC family protein [Silvibacterium dinghuense]|uniref:SRPBCC family protein n=1 Tax=Silvibacterium dinghuense TaxID=1560006 RepID=UPI0019CF331B|nr:SRPBCC family protein [Silvibacterium dinghuense]GGG97962.1 hypothetical protein GCM10011586_11620 [Silvibacterium dinghuense]